MPLSAKALAGNARRARAHRARDRERLAQAARVEAAMREALGVSFEGIEALLEQGRLEVAPAHRHFGFTQKPLPPPRWFGFTQKPLRPPVRPR